MPTNQGHISLHGHYRSDHTCHCFAPPVPTRAAPQTYGPVQRDTGHWSVRGGAALEQKDPAVVGFRTGVDAGSLIIHS